MSTRLPLLTDDQVGPPDLVAAIRKRRGGELIDLDRLLLHSPPFAAGWNVFMGAVRTALTLPPLLKELAMCGVAALNGADFEMHHHAPLYRAAGATEAQLAALMRLGTDPGLAHDPVFDTTQQAVLALVVEMTRSVQVADGTFARARAALGSDQAMFELIGVTAAYNMVSRILVAATLTP
ncbi:MAG TPA: carboxymuconolactone decarboxylase family protein [Aquabacterium sp.]|nr:carboxymuconolactone decarboxylase family protein [Aquabacterium sp.]